jgi:FlaA1/EpsC-like NDP-sugar epimerase
MVVGAGEAANVIIKEIVNSNFSTMVIRCIIDDDEGKWGRFIQGLKVAGGRDKIIECADTYDIDEIIVAMPSISRTELTEILDICKETNCKLRTLPGMYQLVSGEVSVSALRDVEIEDLLGREPVEVDLDSILGYVKGKKVLVTGGGGTIGSELCRQIAAKNPSHLIALDIYENGIYDVQQELLNTYPDLHLTVLIASVRNTNRIRQIFAEYRPEIVYHAAAHKHVPLMEESPNEAIKNNVFGTYKTAMAAATHGTERFVMISTDKAVNPTNIMGASKRVCEMIIQSFNKKYETEFVAVRFGNVLGSSGSVIPIFKKQIAEGGPVTVTHPDIIRYFMTIPEAVSLVLQAGAYAKGGEIFVLDMGKPVKILDLAKNLISLSGFRPDEDIKIEFTGLRPGEKLFEELLMEEEGMKETANRLIYIGKPIDLDEERFFAQLQELELASKNESAEIRTMIRELVPSYNIDSITS